MTVTAERTGAPAPHLPDLPDLRVMPAQAPAPVPPVRLTPRRLAVLVTAWLAVLVTGVAVAGCLLGALQETRSQRADLTSLRRDLAYAKAAASSPVAGALPIGLPATGSPVALLQVPRLGLQRVVVEGARPGDTRDGPGHVPGTAGPGQPGNSAVVGRRTAYGAAFAGLSRLRPGDQVLVTTRQGQSVYRVTTVRTTGSDVLRPSADDRLTLVTAAGRSPLHWSRALVVTATLQGKPFAPTPQGTRATVSDGRDGDGSALATVVVWGTLLLLGSAASVVLYRRWLVRSTYLLSTGALVALLVLTTDALARLLPAWV